MCVCVCVCGHSQSGSPTASPSHTHTHTHVGCHVSCDVGQGGLQILLGPQVQSRVAFEENIGLGGGGAGVKKSFKLKLDIFETV